MTFLIDAGMVMYWGTARWTPFEIFESYSAVSTFPKIFIFSYTNLTKKYRGILKVSILTQGTWSLVQMGILWIIYFEFIFQSKEYRLIGPTVELSEYHWFHREKVELYMAELYNKIGM